jgi:hypothetical protein
MASRFGISADLTYLGKPEEANAELQTIIDQGRSDGDTRLGLFGMNCGGCRQRQVQPSGTRDRQGSSLSQEIKENARRPHHFNLTMIAVSRKDYTTAKAEAEEFHKGHWGSVHW